MLLDSEGERIDNAEMHASTSEPVAALYNSVPDRDCMRCLSLVIRYHRTQPKNSESQPRRPKIQLPLSISINNLTITYIKPCRSSLPLLFSAIPLS